MNVVGHPRTVATAAVDNATATATIAAPGAGFKWLVKSWGASFAPAGPAASVIATVTIGGSTITFGVSVATPWNIEMSPDGIEGADNGAVSIALAASGTAGQLGRVYITAEKVPTNFTY